MVAMKLASTAIAAVSLLASTAQAAVDPIVIKGNKFFYKTNGTQFFIRGVAYQQDTSNGTTGDVPDPLADASGCARDIPNLLALRTNTVRVYDIDINGNHDACMNALADAGIYVVADLGSPNMSINRDQPTWDASLYARYSTVVDLMQKYSNTLGFFAGNEVTNNATNTPAMPFVKAAVRDMKAYIKQKGYRPMGVGYAADDDATIRDDVRAYMNCGDASDSIDFFGYNIYSWCGTDSSFTTSGYSDRTKEFSTYNVPAFFAEYGCNQPSPRAFDDTPVIYSSQMDSVWSGAIVYEYFQATNDYGLVSVDSSGSLSKLADFGAFSSQIAKATPSGVNMGSFSPSNTAASACPPTGTGWAAATKLPPSPNDAICECMVANLTCVANDDISTDKQTDLFNYICGSDGNPCAGINPNGTTGVYGAYSMCDAAQRLSYAMNSFYLGKGGDAQACDFTGNATTTSPTVQSTCSSLLQEAGGIAGTGVVTSQPTNTQGASTSGGSGGGIGGSSSSSVAGAITLPAFDFGVLAVGIYVTVAAMAGAGIILL